MNDIEGRIGKALYRIQAWFKDQCDGDWEHSYSVQIETTDNPGWFVTIGLEETDFDELSIPIRQLKEGKSYFNYEVTDKVFKGSSSVEGLVKVLEIFVDIIDRRI